jgi:hypothetical protein
MSEQRRLWDEPVRPAQWRLLPKAERERVVAEFARLALEAARTKPQNEGGGDGAEAEREER